jgi:transposase-like protein
MPWNRVTPMDEKSLFMADVLRGVLSISEICERFNISRKTGYKLIRRYRQEGPAGLRERGRRPLSCPHRTPAGVEALIVQARRHQREASADRLAGAFDVLRHPQPQRADCSAAKALQAGSPGSAQDGSQRAQ